MKIIKWTSRYLTGYRMIQFVQYDQDVGSLHVLDRLLWLATREVTWKSKPLTYTQWAERHAHRYLDGEEEQEGIYR